MLVKTRDFLVLNVEGNKIKGSEACVSGLNIVEYRYVESML